MNIPLLAPMQELHLNVYVQTYRHTHTNRHTPTDRHTHTNRHTNRHTHTQTDRSRWTWRSNGRAVYVFWSRKISSMKGRESFCRLITSCRVFVEYTWSHLMFSSWIEAGNIQSVITRLGLTVLIRALAKNVDGHFKTDFLEQIMKLILVWKFPILIIKIEWGGVIINHLLDSHMLTEFLRSGFILRLVCNPNAIYKGIGDSEWFRVCSWWTTMSVLSDNLVEVSPIGCVGLCAELIE